MSALVCAVAIVAAGCHRNNLTSGFGIGWVTVTSPPSQFVGYVVTIDSIVLTGKNVGAITAVAAPEVVDFVKLKDLSELWSAASIPNDTYISATITLDYTVANIAVMVNGLPQKATVVDSTGAAVTTQAVTVTFDPANQFTILPTYASTNAVRLALNFDLNASNLINLATSPATVTVKPFFTIAKAANDTKTIRVRGPLINSSVNVGTYTVYVRPFYDEVNSLGSLSLFTSPTTNYSLYGVNYTGTPGMTALSRTSAGTTITAAFTTFEPTNTLNAGVTAGIFHVLYVVGGSTLEDFYTSGLEGDVVARSGNTLTLRGSTLFATASEAVQYNEADAVVTLGPSTIVTEDGVIPSVALDYNSIAVGDHIIVRGIYTLPASGVVNVDATGSSATNTGSVRIQPQQLTGTFTSPATGGLLMDLTAIRGYPASDFNFAGNGASAATDSAAANYTVATGALTVPALAPGDPLFIDGYTSPFGSAPPDFNATVIRTESTEPATLQVLYSGTGTTAPFAGSTAAGLTIDLTNAAFASGLLRIGGETVDITTLPAGLQIIPEATPAATGVPPVFLPLFSVGNTTAGIFSFNAYASFVAQVNTEFTAATPLPATQVVANGTFDRAFNTFTAYSINVVL